MKPNCVQQDRDNTKKTVRLSALYFFIYCPLGVVCPLIGQYLSSIGFTGTQVGVITSLGTAAAIFAGMFWGQVYANSRHKRYLIGFMCFSAGLLGIAGTKTEIFVVYAVIYSAMYFFQGPIHGLCDSLVLSKDGNFSLIRSFGAVGYAAAVFAAGKYAEATELKNIFYIYAAAYLVVIFLLLREEEPPYHREKGEKIRAVVLLKNHRYLKLLLCAFFVMGTNVANSTYFGYLFRAGGGDLSGIGFAFLLMAGSEAPCMMLLPKLTRKFSSEIMILIAMVLSALRFGFYSTGPSSGLLLATFFLQGMVNGILLVELVKYVDRLVEPKYSGVAIAVYYAIGNSLSVIVCSLLGGVILDAAGVQSVYGFFSLYNAAAVALYILTGLYKKEPNEI
ncbi:MAG: MFS transporter [Anaerovoracaceae bacterium]